MYIGTQFTLICITYVLQTMKMLDNFLSTVHQNFKAAAVKFSLQKLTNAAAAARWRQCRSLGAALQLFSRLDIVRKTCYVVQRAHIKCAGFFLRDFLLHVQFLYHACVRVLVHCTLLVLIDFCPVQSEFLTWSFVY